MNRRRLLCIWLLAAGFVPLSTACAAKGAPNQDGLRPALPQRSIAVRAERLHTLAGPPIEDGVVWIEGGRIRAVGPAGEVRLPDGLMVLRAKVATPGLVDAHSTVGLAGWLNEDADKDELDHGGPVQPELRALDAYNPAEPLVGWVRSFGVTTVHTGHAPGALISGQTMIAKTRGNTVEDAVLEPQAMVVAALGEGARGGSGAPGSRAKAAAVLRQELHNARAWIDEQAKKAADPAEEGSTAEAAPARDLRKETLAKVVRGELPLLLTAHRAHDLMTALRLAEEFSDMRLVLSGGSEAPAVLDAILAAKVAVIVHPSMQRTGGEAEALSFTTAKRLLEAGVPIALQSGYEGYVPRTRVVLFEAAIAARHGLSFERALGLVTLDAARLLGIADRVGSLEPGKHGDVALYDGDPFEYTTRCTAVVIEGEAFPGERPRLVR